MIPRIIHQTWKTHDLPEHCKAYVQSWKTLHPDWKHILWSDAELDEFIAEQYPDFLKIFRNYPLGVQRADAARYLLLHHFGGVYTDIDTECLISLNIFAEETRLVFCDEPNAHSRNYLTSRSLDRLLFNGTMVSPAHHPFWLELLSNMIKNRFSPMVLDSTGPIILSATMQKHHDADAFSLNSAHLFCGKDVFGKPLFEERSGDYSNFDLSIHHWVGSWYKKQAGRKKFKFPLIKKAKAFIRSCLYEATKGKQFKPEVNRTVLNTTLPPPTQKGIIAVLIPVRDGELFIENCIALLGALEWPKSQLHITFCEGDSTDRTTETLTKIASKNEFKFGSIKIIHKSTKTKFTRANRSLPKLQRERRGGLAIVRNHLIDMAITPETVWAWWIDVDVNSYPPSVLHQLLAEREKIIVPHCLHDDGSNKTFDLNSFIKVYDMWDSFYYKHVIGGIFQPPSSSDRRIHLGDVRYRQRTPLHGVGGTMLLVHADVHRAGIRFPDLPYKDLIETEGFGQLARDHGIIPIGLPNLIITHPV